MRSGAVLIVEDNVLTRAMARRALTDAGFTVIEAASGLEAVEQLRARAVDIVLQDIALPDVDGVELFARLRAVQPVAVPIIAFTGGPEVERLLAAGFADVLQKPVDGPQLVARLRVHLPRRRPLELDGPPRRLLIIDDDLARLRLQDAFFARAGFDVTSAASTAEGLSCLEQHPPDVVVIDVLMRDLDGFTLCQRIGERHCALPVVLVTGQETTLEHAELARTVGARSIVHRSTEMTELLDAVQSALGRSPAQAAVRRPEHVIETMRQSAERQSDAARRFKMWKAMSVLLSRLGLVARGRPLNELLDEVLMAFIDASGFSCGAAYLREPQGGLELRAQLGLGPAVSSGWRDVNLLDALTMRGEPFAARPRDASPEQRYWLSQMNVASALFIPLGTRGHTVGLIVLATHQHELSDDWLEVAHAVSAPIGQAIELVGTLSRLASSEHRFRGIAESIAEALVVTNEDRVVVYANPAADKLYGAPLLRAALDKLLRFDPRLVRAGMATRADGSQLPVEISLRRFEDPPGHINEVHAIRDLSVQRELKELELIATRDPLTGLYNRRRFDDELAMRLAESRRHATEGALVLIDLDRFKPINDTYGHAAGDAVLRAVGQGLANITRRSDLVARFGGDEFVALVNHVNRDTASKFAAKVVAMIRALAVPFEGKTLSVGASVGVALFPQHGCDAQRLFSIADVALYAAKRGGRNQAAVATGSSPRAQLSAD